MMVLVDTSIWVDHFRRGNRRLKALLLDAQVACHPFVIGELACGNLENRAEILALLVSLPAPPILSREEFLHFIDRHRLMGRGIGFVDVHLLASARISGLQLWTSDKRLLSAARELGLSYG